MRPLIVIPTYNEAKNVLGVIEQILPFAGRSSGQADILVIDDASTDATPEILAGVPLVRLLRHPKNMGYGQAMIDGFEYAYENGFDWVITMDADGQHEAESIPDFLAEMASDQWDLISGSRYLAGRGDDDLPPPERRTINHRVTGLINNYFGLELTDSFCGFKAHRTKSMIDLNLTETGYAFPLQLWPRVWENRLRMKEIPVRRIYNDPNRSFGAHLDDAEIRFEHYRNVLNRELARLGLTPIAASGGKPPAAPLAPKPRVGHGCSC